MARALALRGARASLLASAVGLKDFLLDGPLRGVELGCRQRLQEVGKPAVDVLEVAHG